MALPPHASKTLGFQSIKYITPERQDVGDINVNIHNDVQLRIAFKLNEYFRL